MKVTVASVSQKEIDDILGSSVRGGTLTVGHVFDMKHAKVEDVVIQDGPWGKQAIVSISSPDWVGNSVMLGNGTSPFGAAFDAFERMASALMRS